MTPFARPLVKRFNCLSLLLLAPFALLLSQQQAKAILTVNIFDDGPNLKVTVNGSIAGSPGISKGLGSCGPNGFLGGQFSSFPSLLCSGNDIFSPIFPISGPTGYGGNGVLTDSSTVQGFSFMLIPVSYLGSYYQSTYQLDGNYILGQPFFSSATFNNTSLALQGFTATGLVGTWTIDGSTESINVCIGPDPCGITSTPGPLPLVGAAAAFGWSRRLRKRTIAASPTPPLA